MTYFLQKLPYDYDALEPYIDEETMRIHHDKHHQTYVDKLNAAVAGQHELQKKSAEELLMDLDAVPEKIRNAVRNFGGGHVNHTFFWSVLKKDTEPKGDIAKEIEKQFVSFEKFKELFSSAATTLFGSGWTWLVVNKGRLEIVNTQNQDSPLSTAKIPLLVIDVWEHGYYLKWQNQRNKYIETFWNVINWEQVNDYFLTAKKR